ncbi:PKD domain-containing protein [Cellulomonas phragmiteti]|uniref:PDK repeat-containing protein n=1 Tax=Cellulomonas phragmiteti TaxID=478780 RepID=A0ABQ4DIB5_9CELL|nr:PKD domain-containing protein [Cellulomonas phragmiteti]GIG38661.1 hypothetical protein Cph01nite_04230 [Cellulomonas phragmiteti]
MKSFSRLRTRAAALTAGLGLVLAGAVVPLSAAPAAADTRPSDTTLPATVSADGLPTVQIDGVVWDQVVVDDVVYVAGSFTTARPAGAAAGVGTVTRSNLLAYQLSTGQLISSWAPATNGQVLTIEVSPDKSRIYIGGSFTQVNGAGVWRIAALDRASGNLVTTFLPKPDATVRAIAFSGSTVYFGGLFNAVGTETRTRLAAASAVDGSLLPWAPAAAGASGVNAMVVSPDGSSVVVGGSFTTLNGSNRPGYGLGAVSAATGESLPFEANTTVVRNAGVNGSITALSGDADHVYGSGYTYGRAGGTIEGTFAATWDGGQLVWLEDCHGDTYSVAAIGDVVYQASHKHFCGSIDAFQQTEPWTMRLATAVTKDVRGVIGREPYDYTNHEGRPRPEMLAWFPELDTGTFTGQNQGPWSVAGNDQYVVMGGEFRNVNGRPQQGLVRFAVPEIAPNAEGPRLSGGRFDLSATSSESGVVRLRWTANYDWDNEDLTYTLIRNSNQAAPIHETVQASRFYDRPTMGYVDTGLVPGTEYRYRLRATDPFGNIAWSDTVTVRAATAAPQAPHPYVDSVLADAPDGYWRGGEAAGTGWLRDAAGWNDMRVRGAGLGLEAPGALPGDTALRLTGAATGIASTTPNITAPREFTAEAWIRTTTTTGGRILGFSTAETGTSDYADRHLFMDNQGRVRFGVRPFSGSRVQLASTASYNDGQWHHVVGTSDATGTRLYVDGVRVAEGAAAVGRIHGGYWRIGADTLTGWTGVPTSTGFTGDVDEVAVYSRALGHGEVSEHFTAAGGTVAPLPQDPYGAAIAAEYPEHYWRLDDTTGTAANDSGSYAGHGTYRGTVGRGAPGVLDGVGSAASFNGSNSRVTSNRSWSSPRIYSLETWFRTTSTTGGTIIGLGNSQTGTSTQYDRQVRTNSTGQVTFSVLAPAGWVHVTGPQSYRDGEWHHVVATQSADGMKLYVDGQLVGSDPEAGSRTYVGYWKVGGDTSVLGPTYFTGLIDEVAIYSRELSAVSVAQHYTLGTGEIVEMPPTAQLTVTPDGLSVTADGTASSDPDGTIASWAWDFGDGSTGQGATASHTYAAAGTYPVTLTVTDDDGLTGSASTEVTVEVPPVRPIAADTFGRSTTSGWGTADEGGAWTYQGSLASFSVDSTVGRISVPTAGGGRTALLATPQVTDVDVSATVATPTLANGGGAFASLLGRRVGTADYRSKVKIAANGQVTLYLARTTTAETTLSSVVVPGMTFAPGDGLRLRLEVTGTAPTTLRTKVWKVGTPEPADWQLTATDAVAALQAPGGLGVMAYVSASATNLPVVVTVDDLTAVAPGTQVPVPNVAPVAAFTAQATGLGVAVDGSGSSDPDGTVASYAWDFGDGGTAQGATASHTYGADGTYTVTLTVTDDDGATASTSQQVTVTAPVVEPPVNQAPVAAFTATAGGPSVAVDASGSSDPDGTITSYGWDFGDGGTASGATASHVYTQSGTYTVTLTVTDDDGATGTTSQQVTVTVDEPVEQPLLALDTFERAVAGGWGAADNGGAWTTAGAASRFAVADGVGTMTLASAGSGLSAYLGTVALTDVDLGARFSTPVRADGGGAFASLATRRVGTAEYRAKVKIAANGGITLYLTRVEGGETNLATVNVPGNVAAGQGVNLRFAAIGTAPTTLRAKVWTDGTAEPADWQATVTDAAPALQAPGAIGFVTYLSGSVTTAPFVVTLDDLVARTP